MSDYRTLLIDPQSFSSTRTVFRVERGVPVNSRKIRLLNFGISNTNGSGVYFNHNGVYSLLSKISITNLNGAEIDRLTNMDMMGIRLLHMPNSSQFSLARQISQNMCSSIFVNSFSQVSLTEEPQRDDASLMGNSLYLDVSMMLQYLMARNVLDEGFILIVELADPSVVGFNYTFTRPMVLAVDEVLGAYVPDPAECAYLTIIQDKINISSPATGVEQRLNSFYSQYLRNLYIYNIWNSANNPLRLPLAKLSETIELTIDGRKLIPLKGVNSVAKKLALLHDFSDPVSICNYSSYISQGTYEGEQFALYNPNLGITYNTDEGSGVFSYGCIRIDKYIAQDLTLSYNVGSVSAGVSTVMLLAEVLRGYNRETGVVRFVNTRV